MNEFPPLFAIMEDMREQILLVIRIVLCVFAAVLGWFIASPLFRMMYRVISPKQGIPGAVLLPLRLLSAAGLAAVIWFFLPLNFGSGGWGLGPGLGKGKGPGLGEGKGPGTGVVDNTTGEPAKNGTTNTPAKRTKDKIEIDVVPSQAEKKYYVVKYKDPAKEDAPRTLEQLKKFIEDKNSRFEPIRITGAENAGAGAVNKLKELLKSHKIEHIEE